MRSSFSLRSFDTISMRGRSIRVLPCKMKIAFSGITGDVRRMKMPLPCCDHDNMVEGNWSLCLRSSTPPPWFHASNSRFILGQISPCEDTNLALFSRVEARWSTKWKEFAYINMNELSNYSYSKYRVLLDVVCNYCHDFEYFVSKRWDKWIWDLGNVLQGRGPKAFKE